MRTKLFSMSSILYQVLKNSWSYRILEQLKKEPLTWNKLQAATKLTPYAQKIALRKLFNNKIIKKETDDSESYYHIIGKYEIITKEELDDENYKIEVFKEEKLDNLLSLTETIVDSEESLEALAGLSLRGRYMNLIEEAKESIIVVSPFLQGNIILDHLKTNAEKFEKLVLVTRNPETFWYEKQKLEQKKWINLLRKKNSIVIEDDNIHAKILITDRSRCIISSMNLTKESFSTSKEFGIYTESVAVISSAIKFIREMGG